MVSVCVVVFDSVVCFLLYVGVVVCDDVVVFLM